MKYGYARVSTDDQKADLQIAALTKAGCRHIFTDQGVSSAASTRPELKRCLESLRAGDTLVVWKLDWLGRSLSQIITVLGELQKQGIAFKSLTEAIETESAAGRLLGHMLVALAEFERALIVERTQAGLKAAKQRGQKLGRRPRLSHDQLAHARAAGQGRKPGRRGAVAQCLPGNPLQQLEAARMTGEVFRIELQACAPERNH